MRNKFIYRRRATWLDNKQNICRDSLKVHALYQNTLQLRLINQQQQRSSKFYLLRSVYLPSQAACCRHNKNFSLSNRTSLCRVRANKFECFLLVGIQFNWKCVNSSPNMAQRAQGRWLTSSAFEVTANVTIGRSASENESRICGRQLSEIHN